MRSVARRYCSTTAATQQARSYSSAIFRIRHGRVSANVSEAAAFAGAEGKVVARQNSLLARVVVKALPERFLSPLEKGIGQGYVISVSNLCLLAYLYPPAE